MFGKVLIANRSAIARRIGRTLRRIGVVPVAVFSEPDRHSLHVREAGEAVALGGATPAESYLSIEKILHAAEQTGAEAIHPGYGFLSENPEFAEGCERANITFLGPTAEQMRSFGLKHTARSLAEAAGVPLLPGTGVLRDAGQALAEAARIGYPVMLKSTAGGGGIGMRMCANAAELREAFDAVEALSRRNFRSGGLFLEKFVPHARHVEVQVFGDGAGKVIHLGERDCSVQRRNQKMIEETPAPNLPEGVRSAMHRSAVELCRSVAYRSAGTVEFVYDETSELYYFLEVNTRLQVEHGVTEEVTGVDLVEWMVRLGAGELPDLDGLRPVQSGCAIQARLYAEDPAADYRPSAGRLTVFDMPANRRVETSFEAGQEVSPFYDPMLAKIIVSGPDRYVALDRLRSALADCRVYGIASNLDLLREIADDTAFETGSVTTAWLAGVKLQTRGFEVLEGGMQTTVQDYPGRLGEWEVGVPPSGPMDSLAFRMANRLVGNPETAPGLEVTISGPSLLFSCDGFVAVTGADLKPTLDGEPVAMWTPVPVRAGQTLRLATVADAGSRAYIACSGAICVPGYLGSASTFILGQFGGHAGRPLRAGDKLKLGPPAIPHRAAAAPESKPAYGRSWQLCVLYGPHGAPDFFTPEYVEEFFSAEWTVHYNSDRTGIRLLGPRPGWARPDGGEAGLHPSNIHDNAYAIGTIDFTGDMPVVLGPDGPSLGGFVCPATVIAADLWKLGQLKSGDRVRFHRVSLADAHRMEVELDRAISSLNSPLPKPPRLSAIEPAVVRSAAGRGSAPAMVCRAAGDKNLLIEYGPHVLDLNLRFRVQALYGALKAGGIDGILDLTPGIRSLQVHYDSRKLARTELLDAVDAAERSLGDLSKASVPSRIVNLPLSWDDPATQLAIGKYIKSVRADAPWCPSNIEFIRRINGLANAEDVRRIVFDASYVVLGLGDVYLGAPVATPLDPRHMLVTTKYNPARTWTPENAVGIGGAYLCIYGMEGPGGYQFVGRTLQVWNSWKSTREFLPGTPWLLRSFDRIHFYPVEAAELLRMREAFPYGEVSLDIEPSQFSLSHYNEFLASIQGSVAEFRAHQRAAFVAERERWAASAFSAGAARDHASLPETPEIPEGVRPVCAPVTASVWNIAVEDGQKVEAGQRLIVLEAMKMEIAISSPVAGVVHTVRCSRGAVVNAGEDLLYLAEDGVA